MSEQRMVPETWDWVKHRAGCSASQMFVLLVERLDSDVAVRREQVAGRGEHLTVNRVSESHVVVSRRHHYLGFPQSAAVKFIRTKTGVDVAAIADNGNHTPMFTAVPAIDVDGRCKYRVGAEALELWQVSYRALETLFFHEPD